MSVSPRSAADVLAALAQEDPPKFLFFWDHRPERDGSAGAGCLSQWWPAPFTVDGPHMTTTSHAPARTWFITGASSGIGYALADAAARRGDQVVGVVATIFAAVDAANPPLRLATGRVAVAEMRAALQERLAELESWAPISEASDTVSAAA